MDMTAAYAAFSEQVDACNSIESLQNYRKENAAIPMRNEFWKQRNIVLSSSDPLEKQQAMAKAHWLQQFFGCRIPILRAINQFTAPEGLYGIFISARALLGSGCVISPHVTIGADTFPDSPNAGFPIVGNHVYIGTGATILGNVVIGDHVRIAPNCCVTTDIPSNSIVSPGNICITCCETSPATDYLTPDQFLKDRFDTVFYDYQEHIGDPELHLEQAAVSDIGDVLQLYKDRSAWFKWKKIPQWGRYLQNHPREEFLQKIENGEYYLVKKGSAIIAGFALTADSENWMDETANAWYLCRVVSRVGYITAEAKALAKQAGKAYLRLECVSSNQRLNEIWESLGFAYVREVESSYRFTLREWIVP